MRHDIAPNSVDAIICDPPYGLSFMGKGWDHAVPGVDFWAEALRVAKPGAHLVAFGGTRLFHRLTCAIEDAGWEVRDCLMWLYGTGFPKSHNVSKAIDKAAGAERRVIGPMPNPTGTGVRETLGRPQHSGSGFRENPMLTESATDAARQWEGWGTALKPAWEPIILARKPFKQTVAANVLEHGTGALNIDACRVGTEDTRRECSAGTGNRETWRTGNQAGTHGSPEGRWCGSGSTGVAALLEGMRFTGIDECGEYLDIAEQRCDAVTAE
jgi:site-specific DNA-methyltransferase (adenine-specific)